MSDVREVVVDRDGDVWVRYRLRELFCCVTEDAGKYSLRELVETYGPLRVHVIAPDDRPVPGGPPMREGNNPRTGIAWNE